MRAQANSSAGSTHFEVAPEPQESVPEPNPLVYGAAASDLIAAYGVEHFVVEWATLPSDIASRHGAPIAPGASLPSKDASNVNHAPHRDFWDDVVALSNSGVVVSPNAFGAKPDVIAYAIAFVSARYTTADPHKSTNVPVMSGALANVPRAAPQSHAGAPTSSGMANDPSRLEECDLALVLESLFDFEDAAGVTQISALDVATFDLVRERAAQAVIASNVIRDAALKAAQGRKG